MSAICMLLAVTLCANAQKAIEAPPNEPAKVVWNAGKGTLSISYNGAIVFTGTVSAEGADGKAVAGVEVKMEPKETRGIKGQGVKGSVNKDKVDQTLRFALAKSQEGVKLVLKGVVSGTEEMIPAETQGSAQNLFPLVRNSDGVSRNLRNNAVYERHLDWVLSGPSDGSTRITPKVVGATVRTFELQASGQSNVELLFQPRYYQKHRDLTYYEPWTYKAWKGPITGYCTWWAYKKGFTQKGLDEIVDVFAEKKLNDFGYKYIQIDDSYQIGNGSCPENWKTWNKNFPGGAAHAVQKIKSAGMEAGVWVHRIHRPTDPHVKDIAKAHPDWFAKNEDGTLFKSSGFHVLNTKNKEALDGMVRPIYREHKKEGWAYVKIDGAGDLLNAYNNKGCADHFKKINSTPEQSLRDWDVVAREELGKDIYILTCWGVGPGVNVIGLADGCRLANDGFQPETLANFNSYEGVVWRNDPDHCDILGSWLMDTNGMMSVFGRKDPVPVRTVVRPAICSIAGGVLMVSDKIEAYKDDQNIEGMKRSAPVIFTVPGQLYDAGHGKADTWWLQEIERPFERWAVLSRVQWAKKREKEWTFELKGIPEQVVKFSDLGLESDREYVVFEYWSQKYIGKAKGSFTAPAMDQNNGLQIFAIREARANPWVLSTTRHISQGGVDLKDEHWDAAGKTLSGKSAVVVGDPYVLTVHLPSGFKLKGAEAAGEKVETAVQNETVTVRLTPAATKTIEWSIRF